MRYLFGDYELDDQLYELRRVGAPVELERKVFDVLTYLIQHRDRLVPKDELLDKLWPGQVVGEAALTRCITAARKALGDDGNRQELIKTQHGRGYRFVAAVAAPVPSSELQVPSQQEAVSSQNLVGSSQPIQGENVSANTSELNGDSVMPAHAGIQGSDTLGTARQQETVAPSAAPSRARRRFVLLVGLILVIGAVIAAEWRWVRSLNSPPPVSDSSALPLPDKPSIIVLPFVNLSGDPTQEYFSEGLTDDLITDLSHIPQLFVIARHSAFSYKGKQAKVQEVSREMGVRYILEGSVRRAEGRVRITTQLADATTGEQLWAERYERPLQDIFALQDEIRQKIVTALKVKLTPEEQERFRRAPTANLEAYDYNLRGYEAVLRALQEVKQGLNEQARQRYEKAIELDSRYAGAYAWLGWIYFLDGF